MDFRAQNYRIRFDFAILNAIAGSKSARERVVNVLSYNKPLAACVIGYLLTAFISIFTSTNFSESTSQFLEIILNWYVQKAPSARV